MWFIFGTLNILNIVWHLLFNTILYSFNYNPDSSLYVRSSIFWNSLLCIDNFIHLDLSGTTFRDPSQYLPICGKTIEQQIISLHDNVFKPAKFDVVSFTRLPYLCEGDLNTDFFVLNDIVFVLKPRLGDDGDEAGVLSPDAQCQTGLTWYFRLISSFLFVYQTTLTLLINIEKKTFQWSKIEWCIILRYMLITMQITNNVIFNQTLKYLSLFPREIYNYKVY